MDILILGDLIVRSEGRPVPLPGPSVRALLGVLALTPGEVVGEERLLTLAWGADKGTRRGLQCAAHRLRGWLRDVAGTACGLEHTGSGYRLTAPDDAVDVTRFTLRARESETAADPRRRLSLLAAALGEWRGPVLGGRSEGLDADPVVWAVEQARVDCAAALADLACRLGRQAEAVPLVREVAAAAPYDEPLQAALVRLLATSGRPAEALRQVERVRRRLADDLGIAPSAEIRNAHAAALRGDGRLRPVPRQLPPDVPDFTGRAAETAAISEPMLTAADRHGPLVFVISGLPGIGKTALAVHVAHRTAALFPGGQLYAELRGPDGRPADPRDVLGRFLRVLGAADAAVPAALDDRAALYRSLTADRGLQVILDDAVDEAQVRPLIPGSSGCAVLVTGRTFLGGLAGARQIRLQGLDGPDAVRLLGRVSGRDGMADDPAAARIVRFCDRLPLAVRVAGVRLAARPALSPGRLAAGLRDEDGRLDGLEVHGLAVRPGLDAAYCALDAGPRRTFRLLGLPRTRDFAAWTAAALLDVPVDTATAHLEALADAGLLDPLGDDAAGQLRYGRCDLLRLYAAERARATEPRAARDAAVRRVLGGWLYLLDEVGAWLFGTSSRYAGPARAFGYRVPLPECPEAWYDAESGAVRAALGQAWEHGHDDLTVALAGAALPFLARLGRDDERRRVLRVGLAAADRGGDRTGRLALLGIPA
ncbi:BTAD domain-containing putative transcriptional regulator [Actinomadura sp. NPDC047616]|uniref:AfsR/SARP family transcriptional regulator n=1 Tax=Actinomadura sp. NPDC047616 TaxID=3155914 RepID=UPI0033F59405